MNALRPFGPNRTERAIATARVALAAAALIAIWLDPETPGYYIEETYAVHGMYAAYALVLLALASFRPTSPRMALSTHLIDISLFSYFQHLTLGSSSPFFQYFVFSLFCGALRWGWRGTLGTSILVLLSYIVVGASMSGTTGADEFELSRFIIRLGYLATSAALLVYLARHEVRLRLEIERLAHWPAVGGLDRHALLTRLLGHAAQLLSAERVVVVWDAADEPWMYAACWSPADVVVTKHGPADLDPLVPMALADAVIVSASPPGELAVSTVATEGASFEWVGLVVHERLRPHLTGAGLASAPFRTESVSGRVFVSGLADPTAELMSLTQVVARAIGSALDQFQSAEQLQEVAAREQRLRLARDLHDGVLQSLMGIRLELQTLATDVETTATDAIRGRLLALERALAIEQREIRLLFIEDVKPAAGAGEHGGVAGRLEALRERVAAEWKVPVSIRVHPSPMALSEPLEQAVPLMAHEAIVNALKHASPSRISVDVQANDGTLLMAVSDDGCGFSFRGRREHAELIQQHLGPLSLRERAESLGGHIAVESTETGSRIEIALPLTSGGI